MKSGTIEVEGVEYRWSVYHWARFDSTRGLVGMAILVEKPESRTRELLLEFALDVPGQRCMPERQRLRVSDRRLIECVQKAIRAGWDPSSRGKKFNFYAGSAKPD